MTCRSAAWPRNPKPLVRSRVARVRLAVGGGGGRSSRPPSWDLSTAAADWRPYTTWNARARDLPEAPAAEDRLFKCACVCL